MSFGNNPTTSTQQPLIANQFPLSSVAVPGAPNGDLTALEGGPASTDSNGNKTAPASMYVKDGGDITQGMTTDAAITGDSAGTISAKLRGLIKIFTDVWDSFNHRIKVDGSGVTQPISAASLPLPSGAATSAKQPAPGSAGSASSDVITVQGIASMTPLRTDASATTQPVSGTVTANAGTNLNTSALALESGGHLANVDTQTARIPSQGQAVMRNSLPVVIASDQIVPIADFIGNCVRNGQAYSAVAAPQSGLAGYPYCFGLFNGTGKNIYIFSVRVINPDGIVTINSTTTNPAYANQITPQNLKMAGANSVIMPTYCTYSNAAASFSGPFIGIASNNQGDARDALLGQGILLPAGQATGISVGWYMAASTFYGFGVQWIEY